MASDSILNQLFEIAQSNTKEEIGYNDFKRGLRNSLDVDSDEYFRALKLILLQAKKTPESLGKSNNGSFVFSEGIITKTLLTIKYENQFIPGKPEFNQRIANENMKKDVSGILITGTLLTNMINNYDKLTLEEMEKVSKMYTHMTITQKKDYAEKLEENAIKNEKEAKTEEEKKEWKELRKYNGFFKRIFEAFEHDDIETVKKLLEKNPNIALTIRSKLPSEKSKISLEEMSKKDLFKATTDAYGDIQQYQTNKNVLIQIKNKLEDPHISDEERKHLLEEHKKYLSLEESKKIRDTDAKEKLSSHRISKKSKNSKEERNSRKR